MSASDQLKELLERALGCAGYIVTWSCLALFQPRSFLVQIRNNRRDLAHCNTLIAAALRDESILAKDMMHDIDCLAEDACTLADWTESKAKELHGLSEVAQGDADAANLRQQESAKASLECAERQQEVGPLLERARAKVKEFCAAADKTVQEPANQPVIRQEESKLPPSPVGEAVATGLTRTEEAVLSIIKAQPKGRGIDGKGIIKQLRDKSICLAESSLRKHVLPKLKEHHGVINHRAAGGYLVP